MFTSKNILGLLIITTFFLPNFVFAQSDQQTCSKDGFTILLINGVSTSDGRAIENRDRLKRKLATSQINEFVFVDYLLNPSHFAGLGDALDSVNQKLYENEALSDYDFREMWRDASAKVKTQKILIVGHSQGNFYVNSFYNTLVDKLGGVPSQSMGAYSVASPASYVAGGGRYLTSNNDKVIKYVRIASPIDVLPNNVTISESSKDPLGHDFTEIYMANQGDRIVKEITESLNKLSSNDIQDTNQPCFVHPPSDLTDLVTKGIYMVSDPLAYASKEVAVTTSVWTYKGLAYVGNATLYGVTKTVVFAYNILDAIGRGVIDSTLAVGRGINHIFTAIWGNDLDENTLSSAVILAGEGDGEEAEVVIQVPVEKKILEIRDPFVNQDFNTVVLDEPLILEKKIENIIDLTPMPIEEDHYPKPIVQVHNDNPGSPTPVVVSTPAPTPDTTAPVITLSGDASVYVAKNSVYTDAGASASDAVDGVVSVSTSGSVDTSTIGTYTLTYTATDVAGNTSTATRSVKVSTYVYIPKSTFGTDNGDGNDWQAWLFNGSYIYDWSDSYVDNYLKQTFKIQSLLGYSCGQCLQRGIFNHNPENGFESSDVAVSYYENGRTQNGTDSLYEITTQWDATGYTYTTLQAGLPYDSAHVNVANVNTEMYIGWDGSYNNFQTFPSGNYQGFFHPSGYGTPGLPDYFVGTDMVVKPKPVYVP